MNRPIPVYTREFNRKRFSTRSSHHASRAWLLGALACFTLSTAAWGSQAPTGAPAGTSPGHDQTAAAVANQDEFADPTNAALVYSRVWMVISPDLLGRAGSTSERTVEWRADEKTSQDLASHQIHIESLVRAASIEHADWGIEYSQGIQALLPHLGKMRQTARLLGADARRLIDLGQNSAATSRVVAMLSMPRHCSSDGVLISSLVGGAIATLGAEEAEVLLASNKLNATDRQQLINAIDRLLNDADTFGVSKALRGERQMFLRRLRTQTQGRGTQGGKAVVEILTPLVNVGEQSAALEQVGRLNEVGLKSEFDKAEKFYDEIEKAWSTPANRGEAIADLEKRIDDFGPITKLITPTLSKIDPNVQKALDALKAVRAKLTEANSAAEKANPG